MHSYKLEKDLLQIGDKLVSEDGEYYTVSGLLGRGGQGEAYRVIGRTGSYAVKWYYPNRYLKNIDAQAFHDNLRRNVERGIPALSSGIKANQFIWPKKMMVPRKGSFGYLMELFPSGYIPIRDVILGRHNAMPIRWNSWFTRVTAALNIVSAFEILHSIGLSYQDINDGGFAINPKNGDVFICDCDNVSPDKVNLGILGVKTFMAPEVVRREVLPCRSTDEYSLAVILFRFFLHGHPMIGRESHSLRVDPSRTDNEIDQRIFGDAPHYCLDPRNPVNTADPLRDKDVLQMCMVYPLELMDAFEQVFTKGAHDPSKRLTATEWRKVLLRVRDRIVISDGLEQFYGCRIAKPLPKNCRTLCYSNGTEVLCYPGKYLYTCHMNPSSKDFRTPIAKIIPTTHEDTIGIQNDSNQDFSVSYQGRQGILQPGLMFPLFPGMVIQLGKTTITVK